MRSAPARARAARQGSRRNASRSMYAVPCHSFQPVARRIGPRSAHGRGRTSVRHAAHLILGRRQQGTCQLDGAPRLGIVRSETARPIAQRGVDAPLRRPATIAVDIVGIDVEGRSDRRAVRPSEQRDPSGVDPSPSHRATVAGPTDASRRRPVRTSPTNARRRASSVDTASSARSARPAAVAIARNSPSKRSRSAETAVSTPGSSEPSAAPAMRRNAAASKSATMASRAGLTSRSWSASSTFATGPRPRRSASRRYSWSVRSRTTRGSRKTRHS